jgi:hypothetical protein
MIEDLYTQTYQQALAMHESGGTWEDILYYIAGAAETAAGLGTAVSILLLDNDGLLRNAASPQLPMITCGRSTASDRMRMWVPAQPLPQPGVSSSPLVFMQIINGPSCVTCHWHWVISAPGACRSKPVTIKLSALSERISGSTGNHLMPK